ncbi:MAG: prefoldin subunit alpha [Candidatus Micrarchaeia archaeon]
MDQNLGDEKYSAEDLRYLQQLYEEQYHMLTDSISAVIDELNRLNAVQKVIESSESVDGHDLLIDLGSNFFMKGKALKMDSFIVGIGAGYFVEMPTERAKEYAVKNLERKSAELNALNSNKRKIEESLLSVMYKLQAAEK